MEGSSNRLEVDELANAILSDLLANRKFQRYWAQLTVDALISALDTNEHHVISAIRPCKTIKCRARRKAVVEAVTGLRNTVELGVENFLNNAYFACHPDKMPPTFRPTNQEMSRESSTIYSVRVQLDRLCASTSFNVSQFGLVSRRLMRLMKSFIVGITKPYSITVGASFSATICDMLYRIEEYGLQALSDSVECDCGYLYCSDQLMQLRRSIDDYYADVVKTLEREAERCLKNRHWRRAFCHSKESKIQYGSNIQRYYSMGKIGGSSRILNCEHYIIPANSNSGAHRNNSFILPGKLAVERHKMQYISGRPASTSSSLETVGSNVNRRSTSNRKKDTYNGPIYNGNSDSMKFIEKESVRQTLNITKDCVEKLIKKIGAI